jgi:hypothetical protein
LNQASDRKDIIIARVQRAAVEDQARIAADSGEIDRGADSLKSKLAVRIQSQGITRERLHGQCSGQIPYARVVQAGRPVDPNVVPLSTAT